MTPAMRRLWMNGLAVLCGFGVAFGGVELTLRAAEAARYQKDPASGPTPRGDANWPIVRDDGGEPIAFRPGARLAMESAEYRATAHVDRWGGRSVGDIPGVERPPIPVLGDSQTFGLGVADDQTFVSRLARLTSMPLVNLGIPGSALHHQIRVVKARHNDLRRPQAYVFCFFTGNDLSDLIESATGRPLAAPPWALVEDTAQRSNRLVFHTLRLRNSRAAQLAKAGLLRMIPMPPQSDDIFDVATRTRADARREASAALETQLDALLAVAGRLQFRPVIVVVPDQYQASLELLEARRRASGLSPADLDVRFPNRIVREMADARGIAVVDPLECLQGGRNLFYREGHLTAAGHRKMAECVAPALTSELKGTTGVRP